MPRSHINPIDRFGASSKITCVCGREFASDGALQQHQRDSPLHRAIGDEFYIGEGPQTGMTVLDQSLIKPTSNTGDKIQRYADFRNEKTFPSFIGLPNEYEMDPEFRYTEDGYTAMPRKHWCFLAEIIEVEQFLRLSLFVRDKAGNELRVSFYTDGRGAEIAPSKLQRGYTVAILSAEQHGFLDMSVGIRLEEPSQIMIISATLAEVLQLSDRVRRYATERGGNRICHGCDEQKSNLQKCSKCSLFWYCNKSCQMTGWNDKGHKHDCKMIKNNNLLAMFLFDWDHFENFIEFPLRISKPPITKTQGRAKDTSFKPSSGSGFDKKEAVSDDKVDKGFPTSPQDGLTKTVETCDTSLPSTVGSTSGGTKEDMDLSGRLYSIVSIDGKGKGMVATQKIAKGTRILAEAPIFRVPRDNPDARAVGQIVADEINRLTEDQKRAFLDLTNCYPTAASGPTGLHGHLLGIARTNVLPLGSNARSGGVFLEASRINHSCRHNAQNTWNDNIGCITIHALREIDQGEEITITYMASTTEYGERQRWLKEKFKFDCGCALCSLPRDQRERSDERLRELDVLDRCIGRCYFDLGEPEVKGALYLIHRMLNLFDEEGIWDMSIARAYNDAYRIASLSGDELRARIFAERTWEARRVAEGSDSPVTIKMKEAAEKRADAGQPPDGMSGTEFENWLWRLDGSNQIP